MKGTIATLVGSVVVGAALALPAVSFAQAPGELQRQREEHFPVMHGRSNSWGKRSKRL